jgi:hypothetical protein
MPHIPAKTPHQLNVRWSAQDIMEIRLISEREEQRQSDTVRFLLRWAINQYHNLGSFHALRRQGFLLYNSELQLKAEAEIRTALAEKANKQLEGEEERYDRPIEKSTSKRSAR